jgi:hypothetical protein
VHLVGFIIKKLFPEFTVFFEIRSSHSSTAEIPLFWDVTVTPISK